MHRLFSLAIVLCAACSARYGRAPEESARGAVVVVRGSDTMLALLQRWAERGSRALGGLRVQVTGGGSGTGLRALADGTADIAAASRSIEPDERRAVAARGHGDAVEHTVALDAVALYVHPGNRTPSLSLAQARALYTGRVGRWSALGGPDLPVVLYGRESSSGTYAFFKERVLAHDDYAPEAQSLPGTAAVLQAVARDPGAVGYAGLGESRHVRALPLRDAHDEAVTPNLEAVRAGRYPLVRPLFLYTAGAPSPDAARWIAWALSPAGQAEASAAGFVPAREEGRAP